MVSSPNGYSSTVNSFFFQNTSVYVSTGLEMAASAVQSVHSKFHIRACSNARIAQAARCNKHPAEVTKHIFICGKNFTNTISAPIMYFSIIHLAQICVSKIVLLSMRLNIAELLGIFLIREQLRHSTISCTQQPS